MSRRPSRKRKASQGTYSSFSRSQMDMQLGLALSMSMCADREKSRQGNAPLAIKQVAKETGGKTLKIEKVIGQNPSPQSVKENFVNNKDTGAEKRAVTSQGITRQRVSEGTSTSAMAAFRANVELKPTGSNNHNKQQNKAKTTAPFAPPFLGPTTLPQFFAGIKRQKDTSLKPSNPSLKKKKKTSHAPASPPLSKSTNVIMCSKGPSEEEKTRAKQDNMELRRKMFQAHFQDLVKTFQRIKQKDQYCHFLEPVTPEADPEYALKVSHPIDLCTIEKKVLAKAYTSDGAKENGFMKSVDWKSLREDLALLCNNAMGYNPLEEVPGNVHREAKRLLAFVEETIGYKAAKHSSDIQERLTQEELDKVQAENREPAVQTEWRKKPYKVRKFKAIDHCIAARCLSEHEQEGVYKALQTKISGPPPPGRNEVAETLPDYSLWLDCTEDGNGNKAYALKNPSGHAIDGVDLVKTDVWGIDCYTRKNILLAIGDTLSGDEEKNEFIESVLLPAINAQTSDEAHDMRVALRAIEESKNPLHKKVAQKLASAVTRWEDHNFKVHPKGKGVICHSAAGIQKGEFIKEYQGEVYPAWQWNEREQAVENLTAQQANKNAIPDFWNIQLERHTNDTEGHNILTIDPSQCANFASRMSHSCRPNCATVCIAVNGRYMVAMYSIRSIRKGEELTFDYNAVTESTHEFALAACLCGSSKCRGSFLYLTKTKAYEEIIRDSHAPISRLGMLVRACRDEKKTSIVPDTPVAESPKTMKRRQKAEAKKRKQKQMAKEKAALKKLKEREKVFTKENAPKRPLSDFFVFLREKRADIQKSNPGMAKTELASLAGKMWRTLPEDQRYYFKGLSAELKADYQKKMEAFTNGPLAQFREAQKQQQADTERETLRRQQEKDQKKQAAIDHANAVRLAAMEEEKTRCGKYGLRSSALSGLPQWARRYASKCLAFVEYEKERLPHVLMKQTIGKPKSLTAAEAEAQGVAEQRVHNLVISMDKVRHFLSEQYLPNSLAEKEQHQGSSLSEELLELSAAPVNILSEGKVMDMLWNEWGSISEVTYKWLRTVYSYDVSLADAKIEVLRQQIVKAQAKEQAVRERKRKERAFVEGKKETMKTVIETFTEKNEPKRPLTAFFLFLKDKREGWKADNSQLKLTQLASYGGEQWRAMSDETRAPYLQHFQKDKAAYAAGKKKFEKALKKLKSDEKKKAMEAIRRELGDGYASFDEDTGGESSEEDEDSEEDGDIGGVQEGADSDDDNASSSEDEENASGDEAETKIECEGESARSMQKRLEIFTTLGRIDRLVNTWGKTMKDVKRALTCLRDEIFTLPQICPKIGSRTQALCDLLTLYISTETFFTLHSYRPVRSRTMHIPMADVPGTMPADIPGFPVGDSPYFDTHVEYDEQTVHKEMLHWFEQNNNMSMPNDLYGCVRLPSIQTCFAAGDRRRYSKLNRKTLVDYFKEERFDEPWPNVCKAAFPDFLEGEIHRHVYGSPLFDELLKNIGEEKSSVPLAIKQLEKMLQNSRAKYVHRYNTDSVTKSLQKVEPKEEKQHKNWVQCGHESCMKWRLLPNDAQINSDDPWYCSMNKWDPDRASCDAPEQSYDNNESYSYETEALGELSVGDYCDVFCSLDKVWHCSKIVEAKKEDLLNQYLVHYNGFRARFDVWVSMASGRIKPIFTHTSVKDVKNKAVLKKINRQRQTAKSL